MTAGGQIVVGKINFGAGGAEFKVLCLRRRRSRMMGLRIVHQGQIVGVDIVEQRAGPFVEHVRIDGVGLEQRDAAFPLRMFELETVELGGERRRSAGRCTSLALSPRLPL